MSTTPDTTVSTAPQPSGGIGHWFANQIANLGEFAISRVVAIGDVSMFAFQTVAWIFARRQRREVLLPAFYQIGVMSLPVVAALPASSSAWCWRFRATRSSRPSDSKRGWDR